MSHRRSLYTRVAALAVGFASVMSLVLSFGLLAFPFAAQAVDQPPPVGPPCQSTTVANDSVALPGVPVGTIGVTAEGTILAQDNTVTGDNVTAPCEEYTFEQGILDSLLSALKTTVVMGIIKGAQAVAQKAAIQTAQWVANGAPGGFAAFYQVSFGSMLNNVGNSVLDNMVNEFNDNFVKTQLGFDLCKRPPFGFQFLIGLGRITPLPPPSCTVQGLVQNFDQIKDSLDNGQMLTNLRSSFGRAGGNDFSIMTSVNFLKINTQYNSEQDAELTRQETGGYKAVTDVLSGKITTPATDVKNELQAENPAVQANQEEQSFTTVTGIGALGAGLEDIPKYFALTFLNSLANDLLDELFAMFSGANPDTTTSPPNIQNPYANPGIDTVDTGPDTTGQAANGTEPQTITGSGAMSPGDVGRGEDVPSALSDILTANAFSSEKEDLLLSMSTCPTPRGLWGCSIDQSFATGLQNRGKTGATTVARAAGLGVAQGFAPFLHQDWQLIPDSDAKDNQDPGCYLRAYCSANLAKLRFARILPIGWELAANSPYNQKQNGQYVTLGQVLQGYDQCNTTGMPDQDHPWCKLINPAWVLVAPAIQCDVNGYGSTLLDPQAPIRVQECSEVMSCVQSDDKGNCIGGYGACLSDKTVWRFGGSACSENFTSCRVYRTSQGQQAAYLRDTIDYGSCSANNAGCWEYSTQLDLSPGAATGTWLGGFAVAAAGSAIVDPNVLSNTSFEQLTNSLPTGWSNAPTHLPSSVTYGYAPSHQGQITSGAPTANGTAAVVFTAGQGEIGLSQVAAVQPSKQYVLSFYARRDIDPTTNQPTVPGQAGVNATYYTYNDTGSPPDISNPASTVAGPEVISSISPTANGVPTTDFMAQYTGYIVPDESGNYTFELPHTDGARMWLNGTKVVDQWTDTSPPGTLQWGSAILNMTAGKPVSFEIDYYNHSGMPNMYMAWKDPNGVYPNGIVMGGSDFAANLVAAPITTDIHASIHQLTNSVDPLVPVAGANPPDQSGNCTVDATQPGSTLNKDITSGMDDSWQRYYCSFTTKPDATNALVQFWGENSALDAVSLEPGTTPSQYVDADQAGAAPMTGYTLTGPRIYFDSQAQTCDASGDGCTKLYAIQQGQPALNLIRNSSFETPDTTTSTQLDGWSNDLSSGTVGGGSFVYSPVQGANSIAGAPAYDGQTAAYFWDKSVHSAYQLVDMQPLRNYAVSFYARRIDASAAASTALIVRLLKQDAVSGQTVDQGGSYFRSANCVAVGTGDASFGPQATTALNTLTDEWQRYDCEFVTDPGTVAGRITLSAMNAAVDAVQLEESQTVTTYVDGLNTNLPEVHSKIAPPELGCTGGVNDNPACSKYARVCQQADMGCQGYTPVNGPSTIEIPAQLTPADYCPATCDGYAEYRKLPSTFDLVNTGAAVPSADPLDDPNDDTTADFVPSDAQSCTAAAVGCEAFTNIETSANGGESQDYYSYARACRKPTDPGETADTYFTWEGSDTTGFQLKTWALVKADQSPGAPVGAPAILSKVGPDGILKDPTTCNANSWKTGVDLDCRQFYDTQGDPFYVYFSQTILSSADCVDYRKDSSDIDDCTKTGGDYQQQAATCIYHILPAQSNVCTSDQAGCRAYIGSGGRDSAVVLNEPFTGTSTVFVAGTAQTRIAFSDESLLVGDKSLKVQTNPVGGMGTVSTTLTAATDSTYLVSFWLKTDDTKSPQGIVQFNGKDAATFVPSIDWSRYQLGPFRATGGSISVGIEVPDTTFIDQVEVSVEQDTYYVKKDSWTVPPECDLTPEGIPQPHAMLGCQGYQDRNGNVTYAYKFSRLCAASSIGCTGFVDTRNSDSPYAQSFTLKGVQADPSQPDVKPWDSLYSGSYTVTRPADRYIYIIDDPAMRCPDSAESCRAFGKAQFDSYGKLSGFSTVYLKDDITQYLDSTGEPNALCRPSDLFCNAYTAQPPGQGQIQSYFRDPNKHVCVWQDRVTLAIPDPPYYQAGTYSGWFVADASPPVPCYPNKLSNGNTFLLDYSGDNNYQGWTSACPVAQGECTMFRDPNDRSDLSQPEGKPYYFVNDTGIDKTSCNGQVDPLSGCVLLRDTGNGVLTYSTQATYRKAHNLGDSAVTPVNCPTDGTLRDTECAPADVNDANLVVRVRLDRDCATWVGCRSGETLFDPVQGKYVDICSDYGVCDKVGTANSQYCGEFIDRRPPGVAEPSGYQEPVLRQGRFIDALAYAGRNTGITDPDYSGYTSPNEFQLNDLVLRPVGYDILEAFPDSVKDQYANDYRMVAAVPIAGQEIASNGAAALPNAPDNLNQVGLNVSSNTCKAGDTECEALNFQQTSGQQPAPTPFVTGKIDKSGPSTVVTTPSTLNVPSTYDGYYAKYLPPDSQFPYLHLCQQTQTGLVGYYLESDNPRICYFSVEQQRTSIAADLNSSAAINPRNAQNAAITFLDKNFEAAKIDTFLNEAYPPAECKAYPAADSPFPNQYVKDWNANGSPKDFADGYKGVSYCENGQDCDCSYRKASYGGTVKYYAPFGMPPLGVCVNGTNAGASCSPYETDQITQVNPDCGQGGVCTTLDSSELVNGLFGQCLLRDTTRVIAGSQSFNPCLIWNPLLTLHGASDVQHYSYSAGYIAPPNAGQYYCISNMTSPQTYPMTDDPWFEVSLGGSSEVPLGLQSPVFDQPLSLDSSGNTVTIPFMPTRDDKSNNVGMDQQTWLAAGGADDKTYWEYFIQFNAFQWYSIVSQKKDTNVSDLIPGNWSNNQDIMSALETKNFNQIRFDTVSGTAALGTSSLLKDTPLTAVQYDNQKDYIDVTNLSFLIDPDTGVAKKIPCAYSTPTDGSGTCYYKFAQMSYNASGQDQFKMMDDAQGGARPFLAGASTTRPPYLMLRSNSSQPYFAIRAMFEDGDPNENSLPSNFVSQDGHELNGPWRLVGFWVTVSSGDQNTDLSTGLLKASVLSSPICNDVASVVSPATGESTPYMNRIWSKSNYQVPVLGFTFKDASSPFGSVPNSGPIGSDPLFHPDVDLSTRGDAGLNRSFPGGNYDIYASESDQPAQNWAWLTNLFARIYRIYSYYDTPVTKSSWACVEGPNFGTWCPNLSQYYEGTTNPPDVNGDYVENIAKSSNGSVNLNVDAKGLAISRQYCGYNGVCTPLGADSVAQAQPRCNALSGVNAGLPCSSNQDDEVAGYNVCHNAPVKRIQGVLVPLYNTCEQHGYCSNTTSKQNSAPASCKTSADCSNGGTCLNWVPLTYSGKYETQDGNFIFSPQQMASNSFFQCADGSVVYPDGQPMGCSSPTPLSKECPEQVTGGTDSQCINNRCSNGFEAANCNTDKDCEFTWFEYWGGQNGTDAPALIPANHMPLVNSKTSAKPLYYTPIVGNPGTVTPAPLATAPYTFPLDGPKGTIENLYQGFYMSATEVISDDTHVANLNYPFLGLQFGRQQSGDTTPKDMSAFYPLTDPTNQLYGTGGAEGIITPDMWWDGEAQGDYKSLGTDKRPVGTDIAAHNLAGDGSNSGRYAVLYDNSSFLKRFPGAYKAFDLGYQNTAPPTIAPKSASWDGSLPAKVQLRSATVDSSHDSLSGKSYTTQLHSSDCTLNDGQNFKDFCPSGQFCDTQHGDPAGDCEPNGYCVSDNDCGGGQAVCQNSICIGGAHCSTPSDCVGKGFGDACGPNKLCTNFCESNDECQSDSTCVNNSCTTESFGVGGGPTNANSYGIGSVPPSLGVYIPGHCEAPPVDDPGLPTTGHYGLPYEYDPATEQYGSTSKPEPRYTYEQVTNPSLPSNFEPWTPGVCSGGVYNGRACVQTSECQPTSISETEKARAGLYCQPVSGQDGKPRNVTFYVGDSSNVFNFNCVDPTGDPNSKDLDTDDNSCTHGTGYFARADLCNGSNGDCLTSMAPGDGGSVDVGHSPLPTDVTNGNYSPSFLGAKLQTNTVNPLGYIDDRYVSYYEPRPPTVAAPDTSHQCASPNDCPISTLNSFTLENQTQGFINMGGGSISAELKFYAWAADDQTPLKNVYVDWGDGYLQQINDSQLKNHKPICGSTKECQFVTGLACSTDNDCPAGAGKCVNVGYCAKRPNIRCQTDDDCSIGSTILDKCVTQETFGNSPDACDQSYFDFTHVYKCTDQQKTGHCAAASNTTCSINSDCAGDGTANDTCIGGLPLCGVQNRCSRDPNRNCSVDTDCAPGDTCEAGLAPSGGCYDATRADCRYTPRVMVEDNWGWCTGECRLQPLQGGRMGDAYTASQSSSNQGIANFMLFENGGCYDGSKEVYNDRPDLPFAVGSSTHTDLNGNLVQDTIGGTKDCFGGVCKTFGGTSVPDIVTYSNACDPTIRGSQFRPWIVFQGALQLGLGQ